MSSRRFELLLKFLHLNDSRKQPGRAEPGYDKLYKVRPILDVVLEQFKVNYTLSENVSIDESMIGFKGRLAFLQYMPNKPHKWGMKAWVLADAANGYTWGWQLYTGKESVPSVLGLSHRVVLELLDDPRLQPNQPTIYMDNFYSSPVLFSDLVSRGFAVCGTLRSIRRGIPEDVKGAKLQKGEMTSVNQNDLLFLKWKDKRDVLMLSTFHDDSIVDKRRCTRRAEGGQEVIQKPKVVEDYNQHMGGVDKSDQMILYYGYAHRSLKWWKRIFFHLVDMSIVNAHVLHNATAPSRLTQLEFRIAVAKGLLQGYEVARQRNRRGDCGLPLRLTERAFPEPIPDGKRADCLVCSQRGKGGRHQTRMRCKGCKAPLCVHPCFERYHTVVRRYLLPPDSAAPSTSSALREPLWRPLAPPFQTTPPLLVCSLPLRAERGRSLARRTPSLPGHDRLGLSAAPLTPSGCTGRCPLPLDRLSTPSRK